MFFFLISKSQKLFTYKNVRVQCNITALLINRMREGEIISINITLTLSIFFTIIDSEEKTKRNRKHLRIFSLSLIKTFYPLFALR